MSANILFSVAAGGAIGAVGRYLVMGKVGQWLGSGFPFATLAVNVIGSFVLGSLLEIMALAWSPSEQVRAFLVVGLLGAFTTFSTFSMDLWYLIERGQIAAAGVYMLASVAVSLAAFIGGLYLMRQVLA